MQPTEEQIHDIAWRDMTREGFLWACDQMPESRGLPKNLKEHEAIFRRIKHLLPPGTPPPPLGQMYVPRGGADLMANLQKRWLSRMPWLYTAYMSDLNAYWHWYQHIRPGFHSWTLAELQEDRAGQMYKICRAIANERKAIRLGKA